MKRLPNIDLFYWTLLISANTFGETAGDLISQTLNLGYGAGTVVLFILFLIALSVSISSDKQNSLLYWGIITLTSTLGTTVSDFISRSFFHLELGFTENQGYTFGTIILTFSLIFTFKIWKHYSKTNAIESGLNKPTEFLYWIAILTSSTLGTSVGDLLAHNTPLGFDGGTLFLLGILVVIAALFFFTKLSRGYLYWFAIIVTHPIGATIGDYMTKPEGFNLGNITSSLVLVGVFMFVISVALLIKTKNAR